MRSILLLSTAVLLSSCGPRETADRVVGLRLTIELDDTRDAVADLDSAADRVVEVLRARADEGGFRNARIERVGGRRIRVELARVRDVARVRSVIQRTGLLELSFLTDGEEFLEVLPALDATVAAASSELEEPRPLTALLLDFGEPGVLLVEEGDVETVRNYLALPEAREDIPESIDLVWGAEARSIPSGPPEGKPYRPLYVVEADPVITSEHVEDVLASRSRYGTAVVPFRLTPQGGRIFQQATSQHIGDRVAIILDGEVQGSPPIIRTSIARRGQIELGQGASIEDAQDIALILRAGALPVPIKIVEQRTTGPGSGAE